MSVINAVPLLAAAGGDYQISRSVRLRSSATAYFNRTLTTPTSQNIWSFSCWLKRGSLADQQFIFWAGTSATNDCALYFSSSDQIGWFTNNGSSVLSTSTAVFRDPSAWYHIVAIANSTTMNVYVNNQQVITNAGMTNNTINSAIVHNIGRDGQTSGNESDGYLTEINFIDGQALTPSSFGENDTVTGVWKPKKYAGTYGTNGFYLNFSDNSNNTATTIGKDYSGNGNNWTPNNISVTSGTTYDSMLDVPTMWADGGNGRGNYAVMNPLNTYGATLTNGNLQTATTNTSNDATNHSTIGVISGKWYAEFTLGGSSSTSTSVCVGVSAANSQTTFNRVGQFTNGVAYLMSGSKEVLGSGQTAYGSSYTYGDIIGVALDLDASPPTVTFYKNSSSQGTINLNSGSAATGYHFGATVRGAAVNFTPNFGQQPFTYTPPSGFKALNTQNLPDSTIPNGRRWFDATTYTGNGSTTQTISTNLTPDFVWIKSRTSGTGHHSLMDSVRGAVALNSNQTIAEYGVSGFSIGSNSITVPVYANDYSMNTNSQNYVGWQWKANGAGSTNSNGTAKSSSVTVDSSTDTVTWNSHGMSNGQKIGFFATTMPGGLSAGTLYYVRDAATNTFKVAASSGGAAIDITSNGTTVTAHTTLTSTVSANTTAGFSIVTFTGTGANATVEHGLGVAPSMVIVKKRSSGGALRDWCVYHQAIGNTDYLILDTTAGRATISTVWNNTSPTSSVISIGSSGVVNDSTYNMVAYCFSAVAGYSAFGSYTGNGSSTDGPFVYLGFRPRFIMTKRTDSTSDWQILDTSRNTYNVAGSALFPNSLSSETTNGWYDRDFLSNGFKIRASVTEVNASGGSYLYACFAESPFKLALAR